MKEGTGITEGTVPEVAETTYDGTLPVNLAHLGSFTGDDREEMHHLCAGFLEQAHTLLTTMAASRGAGQHQAWREAAHKLKGSASNLGAAPLSLLAGRAEEGFTAPEEEKKKQLVVIQENLDIVRRYLVEQLGDFK